MATIKIPKCFASKEQYALWMRSARSTKPGRSGYCEDCTPDYKRKMVEQQRCEYPATWFHADEDGFVAGVRVGGGIPGKRGRPRKYA